MGAKSSLTAGQRVATVTLFEAGRGPDAVASWLGVSRSAVIRLYDRWRVRGDQVLVAKRTRRSFTFEFKRDVVERFMAGETKVQLAREFDLSSPKLVEKWARAYRKEGLDGLRPKPRRRVHDADGQTSPNLKLVESSACECGRTLAVVPAAEKAAA